MNPEPSPVTLRSKVAGIGFRLVLCGHHTKAAGTSVPWDIPWVRGPGATGLNSHPHQGHQPSVSPLGLRPGSSLSCAATVASVSSLGRCHVSWTCGHLGGARGAGWWQRLVHRWHPWGSGCYVLKMGDWSTLWHHCDPALQVSWNPLESEAAAAAAAARVIRPQPRPLVLVPAQMKSS